jgi:5-methylcytosine-specific restriction endonuclease McrA
MGKVELPDEMKCSRDQAEMERVRWLIDQLEQIERDEQEAEGCALHFLHRRKQEIEERLHRILRPIILKRDGFRCRRCGSAEKLELVRLYGGIPFVSTEKRWAQENLFILCADCHRQFDSLEGRIRRISFRISSVDEALHPSFSTYRTREAMARQQLFRECPELFYFCHYLEEKGWRMKILRDSGEPLVMLEGPEESVVFKIGFLSTYVDDIRRIKALAGRDRRVLYYLKISRPLTTEQRQDLFNHFKVVFVEFSITPYRFYRVGALEMCIAQEFQRFLKLSYREVMEIEKEKFLQRRKRIVSSLFCMV